MRDFLRAKTPINSFVAKHPLITSIGLGTSTKLAIDAIVQSHEATETDEEWKYDQNRGAAFGLFGAIYLGVCQVTCGSLFDFITLVIFPSDVSHMCFIFSGTSTDAYSLLFVADS